MVARTYPAYRLPDLCNNACSFVSEDAREDIAREIVPSPEIRVTDAASCDLDADFIVSRRLEFDIFDNEGRPRCSLNNGSYFHSIYRLASVRDY
jgi:hypothetical protein